MRGGVIRAPAFAKPTARQAVLGLDGVRGEGTDRTYGTYTTYMIYERVGSILGAGGARLPRLRLRGVASILRAGLREIFVPKGLQDSAWGFNPRNTFQKRSALKGRQIVGTGDMFG
jgi:hypothetical protein